jgi:hypothetical protein
MHERVPAEFMGRARDLRRRIAASEGSVEPAMHRLLAPIARRLQHNPTIRPGTLTDVQSAWRSLGGMGRVRCSTDITNRRRPEFSDVRIRPGIYRGLEWHGDYEPGLAVMLITASVSGADLVLSAWTIAVASLHAIARRYQRGSGTTDAKVLEEIGQLALGFPTIAPDGGDFTFPVSGGLWCGHVVETRNNQVVLAARTFIDADAPALAA